MVFQLINTNHIITRLDWIIMDIFPQGQFTSVVLDVQLQLQVGYGSKCEIQKHLKTLQMFGYDSTTSL